MSTSLKPPAPKLFRNRCRELQKASGLEEIDYELLISILSSFITGQHIVVTADNHDAASFVQQWLELIAANIIGIEDVVTITFHPNTTWEDVEETLMSVSPDEMYCEMPAGARTATQSTGRSRSSGGAESMNPVGTVDTRTRSSYGDSRIKRANSNRSKAAHLQSEGNLLKFTSRYGSVSYEHPNFASTGRRRSSSVANGVSPPLVLTPQSSDKMYRAQLPRFIVFKDLDRASREIQSLIVQGLVLKKVVCNGIEYPFPHFSVMVTLINLRRGKGVEGLMPHLKDLFFFRHHVDLEDALNCSLTREDIRRRSEQLPNIQPAQLVTAEMIQEAVERIDRVVIIPEIRVYMQDIVVFLRTHRLVQAGRGVSPKVVKDFERLLRILCVVENSDYATPTLVAKAARKVFPLKVDICRRPEDEPTLHYGSDIKLISNWLQKWDAELIIEDVLNIVPAPS